MHTLFGHEMIIITAPNDAQKFREYRDKPKLSSRMQRFNAQVSFC